MVGGVAVEAIGQEGHGRHASGFWVRKWEDTVIREEVRLCVCVTPEIKIIILTKSVVLKSLVELSLNMQKNLKFCLIFFHTICLNLQQKRGLI